MTQKAAILSGTQGKGVSGDSGCNRSVLPFGLYDSLNSVVLETDMVDINVVWSLCQGPLGESQPRVLEQNHITYGKKRITSCKAVSGVGLSPPRDQAPEHGT